MKSTLLLQSDTIIHRIGPGTDRAQQSCLVGRKGLNCSALPALKKPMDFW